SMPNSSPDIAIRSRLTRKPRVDDVLVEDIVRTGDSVRTEAGLPPGVRRARARSLKIPVFDRFESALDQKIPYAWVIPADEAQLLEPLRRHGIFVEQVSGPVTVRVDRFAIDSVVHSARQFQGHQEVRLTGRWEPTDSMTVDPGMYVIRGAQPLGILALYLLEPESDDGLVTWNFVDAWIRPGARYPIAR